MRINRHVPSCAAERFAFTVRDVLLSFRITVLLRHAEIDDVDGAGALCARSTDQEVVGLDISVDQVLFVYCLHSRELCEPGNVSKLESLPKMRSAPFALRS